MFNPTDKTVFVGRRNDGSMYGFWGVRQWPGQEEMLADDPQIAAYRNQATSPQPTSPISDDPRSPQAGVRNVLSIQGPLVAQPELLSSIVVDNQSNGLVLFSQRVDNLVAQDIVQLSCQFEVTNNTPGTIGVGRAILRGSSSSSVLGQGVSVVKPAMDNVNPVMHHKVCNLNGFDTGVTGTAYYNVLIWAYSTDGGSLVVEQGYGDLKVVVIKRD